MSALATELLRAAAKYAHRGWHVLPVAGKVPLTRHGYLDATADIDVIRSMFATTRASGIAVSCAASSLLVIDVDGEPGMSAWTSIAACHGGHDRTLVAVTGGGFHLFFETQDPRARSTTGRLAPHVDTRGIGGFVVVPPSRHSSGARYRWRDPDAPVAAAPDWLLELLERPTVPGVGVRRDPPAIGLTRYGEAALVGLADAMLTAAEGSRNTTLVGVSYRAGRLSAAGEIAEDVAHDVLITAAERVGLHAVEAERTFRSGFGRGSNSRPRGWHGERPRPRPSSSRRRRRSRVPCHRPRECGATRA